MVNILEKINEFIEKIRDNIPVSIYQKIINIRSTFLRDYPLFKTFLANEFDESQEDLTPKQYYQLFLVNLREIFPKFTESCISFHLSDMYDELVHLISQNVISSRSRTQPSAKHQRLAFNVCGS